MTSPDNPRQLAEEIVRTRERLGETVEALSAKVDVKARAQDKTRQLATRLKVQANQAGRELRQRPVPLVASAAAVAAFALVMVLFKQSRR